MTGGEVALAEDGRVAERRLRLTARGLHLAGQLGQVAHHPHAASAAAGRRLDQHGQLVGRHGLGVELLEHRHARRGHHLLGLDLRAHRRDGGDRRTDPRQPGVEHCGGELGVLGEESVSGVDGVGARRPRGRDQLRGVEVSVAAVQAHPRVGLGDMRRACVGIGVDGDGADAETTAGGEHAAGDLPAVGDQNSCRSSLLTSGRRRSSTSPRSGHWRWRTGTFPARCGCRAGR